jgi:hypothetical protein
MKLHTLQMQFNPQAYSEKKKTEKKEENHGTNYEHRTIIIPTGIYFQNRKRRRGLFATIDLMEPK